MTQDDARIADLEAELKEANEGWMLSMDAEQFLQSKLADREAELARCRTTEQAAAHALDTIRQWMGLDLIQGEHPADTGKRIMASANEMDGKSSALEAENLEQARLLGMGSEREAALRGKVARLESQLAAANERVEAARHHAYQAAWHACCRNRRMKKVGRQANSLEDEWTNYQQSINSTDIDSQETTP